jgi:hypothetical protein
MVNKWVADGEKAPPVTVIVVEPEVFTDGGLKLALVPLGKP